MLTLIPASIVLGLVWNIIAVGLMGGSVRDALAPGFLLAGACAGVAAGAFAIWSRHRMEGRESLFYGIANYYVGIVAYWLSYVVIQRIILCAQHGGWTDFDLQDHLGLIVIFLMYGTISFGVFLIPLCFLTRLVLWKVYALTTKD